MIFPPSNHIYLTSQLSLWLMHAQKYQMLQKNPIAICFNCLSTPKKLITRKKNYKPLLTSTNQNLLQNNNMPKQVKYTIF